ncbi:hypothetical protein NDU88_008026 [Pleurodeles waltl]|uniref:Uncharacterized protein n=1 Tax=Pleurodeles waltl TaxID=8319 RepID=A0AAV7QNI9_PLEWA|nr:hypothetical protein NDU88_008026 [Pleurodeles waltl]
MDVGGSRFPGKRRTDEERKDNGPRKQERTNTPEENCRRTHQRHVTKKMESQRRCQGRTLRRRTGSLVTTPAMSREVHVSTDDTNMSDTRARSDGNKRKRGGLEKRIKNGREDKRREKQDGRGP